MEVPRIEFPCDYPIKVIGDSSPDFVQNVLQIVRQYDATLTPDCTQGRVREKASRNGNYTSVRILFRATGEPQLKQMFESLKQYAPVQMVL